MLMLQQLARALGGEISGNQVLAPGPGHSLKDRSLSIKLEQNAPGGFLVHSFSGDDPILCKNYVREKLSLPPQPWATNARCKGQGKRGKANGTETALAIWNATAPADGTMIETYFAERGLYISAPPTIRFHPGLKHRTGPKWPAMVALVTDGVDDKPLGIHRTFLACDGRNKAPVHPQKMMLGPCRGGVVRLAPAGDVLMVGEGIETCLAAMQATDHPAWAALSASFLRTLNLPDDVRDVIVIADGDEPGEAAARHAALRWKSEGRRVRIARPTPGMDFNDMLMGRAPKSKGGM